MPWISTNLAGAMGGIAAKATAAVADLQKTLGTFDKQIQGNLGQYASALDAISSNKSLLSTLSESGIYTIILAPAKGAWTSRLQSAANSPPGSGWCCGTATITLSADLGAALNSLDKMKSALEKPIDAATSSFMDTITDISDVFTPDPEPTDMVSVDTNALKKKLDDVFLPNSWTLATMGDVFCGAASVAGDALNASVKAGKSLLKQRNMLGVTKALTNKGMQQVNGLLTDMAATGVYNILLEPGAGNYLTRLQNEVGAPPQDANMFSSGIVCISIGPDISSLTSKFATMNKLIKGI